MISTVSASYYTPSQLFSALDLDYNGIITPDEVKEALMNMESIIKIKKDECSCFRCDGTHYLGAEFCDIYDNSGCLDATNTRSLCYTTNVKKCECNTYSKNPYICKIPLTYSFVELSDKNKNVKYINTNKEKTKVDISEELSERSYRRGRNSAMNEIADIATNMIIADAIGSVFSVALEDKDPY